MTAQPDLFADVRPRPESLAPTAPYQRTSRTSREAAAAVRPKAKNQRQRVLESLLIDGPATMHMLAVRCGIPLQSICARCNELRQQGLALPTTKTRRTPAGSRAAVWTSEVDQTPKTYRGSLPKRSCLPGEEWRPVTDWPYEVSSLGRVRRANTGRGIPKHWVLKPRQNRYGYVDIKLRRGSPSESRKFLVHALVAVAFIGPRPDGYEVNHKNGLKDDNRAENLEYLTPSENQLHANDLGIGVVGQRNGRSKLTVDQVQDIRSRFASGGITKTQLASEYGVSCTVIGHIISRKLWRRA